MDTNLAIKAADSQEERRLAGDLIAREHESDDPLRRQWVERFHCAYPGHRPEHIRIALWSGELAAALRINTDTIRLGEARLKLGGLGWLTTAKRYRGRGIAPLLLSDAMAYLRTHSFHVAMMFASDGEYHPFEYSTSLAEYAVVVDTTDGLTFSSPYRVRSLKPGDIRTLQRIHNDNDAEAACSIVRSSAHFSATWSQWESGRVLTDEQGRVVAYFLARPGDGALEIDEVGVLGYEACPALVAACAELAADAFLGKLSFNVPPVHPLARYLLQFPSRHEQRVAGSGGGMMAFVDLGEALESLIPEWEYRLSEGPQRDQRSELTLVVDGTPYRIRNHRGAVDVALTLGANKVALKSKQLMHLVTGYGYADAFVAAQRPVLSAEARQLLAQLFPKRTPFVWPVDRY